MRLQGPGRTLAQERAQESTGKPAPETRLRAIAGFMDTVPTLFLKGQSG